LKLSIGFPNRGHGARDLIAPPQQQGLKPAIGGCSPGHHGDLIAPPQQQGLKQGFRTW